MMTQMTMKCNELKNKTRQNKIRFRSEDHLDRCKCSTKLKSMECHLRVYGELH